MKLHISSGNTKLGNIPNLNLTPGPEPFGSCAKGVPCEKICYAMKAWRQYPLVRKQWTENLELWRVDPAQFERDLYEYLGQKKPIRFRWHAAGDIPDQAYFKMMDDVAVDHPGTEFLAYTKRYELDTSNHASNLSVVYSRWPGYPFPEHLADKPQAHFEHGLVSSMDAGADSRPCPGSCRDCNICWKLRSGRSILFTKH